MQNDVHFSFQNSELKKRVKIPTDVQYSDIYSRNSEKQLKIVKLMKQLLRTREMLLQ